MRLLVKRLWQSPTFTTWASFGTRTLNLVLVLPLVLRQFTVAEVALWQVFSSLIGLQLLVDLGFNFTFARLFAYATGGAADLGSLNKQTIAKSHEGPNWDLLRQIFGVTRLIYYRLSWLLCGALLFGGTLALLRRVQALNESTMGLVGSGPQGATSLEAWLAWGSIIGATVFSFRSSTYTSFLQGTNHVALIRRWEAFFGLGSILTSVVVLTLGGGLLALVLSNQSWVILNAWRNRWLVKQVCDGRFKELPRPKMVAEIFAVAWPPAWRTGAGTFFTFGVIQISGLIYAQSRDTVAVATYLLSLRLVQTLSQISQAPFYSKLPILASYWAQGRFQELIGSAKRGMALAYWAFVLPFIAAGLLGPWLLNQLDSQTPFPSPLIWGVMGAAFFGERYGAMHLHLYGTTNHIVSHIANGVTGLVFIGTTLLAFPKIGVLALPLGMLAGYWGFYAWYCARLSHRKFALPWPGFDSRTVLVPACFLIVYVVYAN